MINKDFLVSTSDEDKKRIKKFEESLKDKNIDESRAKMYKEMQKEG